VKRLLLVGGGHSHVEVLRRFALTPLEGVELILVSPGRFTPYSGMLPGLVAGHYSFEECHIDLEQLTGWAKARFLPDRVTGLDLKAKRARCEGGEALYYDLLSLDIGSTPPVAGIRGAQQYGVPVKPVERLLKAWRGILADAGHRTVHLLTVGGGAGGVELTLAMQHHARQVGARAAFCVVTDSDAILPGHAAAVRRRMERVMRSRDVATYVRSRVSEIDAGHARLANGTTIPADHVVWATGASAPEWPREAGLATNERGFVLVGETLQSHSHPEVFAAGDIATMERHPRPKSGVYAVRQGPPLADNLRRVLTGAKLGPYLPQRIALALISTGDRHAIASWGPIAWEGDWVWRWKDRIDRKFMARYRG
jgi:selenide, water dikinase